MATQPFRLETTLERLTEALEIFKLTSSVIPARPTYSDEEAQKVTSDRLRLAKGMDEFNDEIRAIFYTLKFSGVKEKDFAQMIEHVKPEGVLVTIDPSFPTGVETFREWQERNSAN